MIGAVLRNCYIALLVESPHLYERTALAILNQAFTKLEVTLPFISGARNILPKGFSLDI